MELPVIKALFFYPQHGGTPRLIDATPLRNSTAAEAAPAGSGGNDYQTRDILPPLSLKQLAAAGAVFDLSRQGHVRAWVGDTMHGAEAEADCRLHGARLLIPEEVEYLGAYLISMGRRWNDVDQVGALDRRSER
jgi:hypothetical protein